MAIEIVQGHLFQDQCTDDEELHLSSIVNKLNRTILEHSKVSYSSIRKIAAFDHPPARCY